MGGSYRGDAVYTSLSTKVKEPTKKSILKAWNYCAKKARSVEIVYRDDELEEEVLTRVHFSVNINNKIKKQIKNKVKFKVDRSTHAEKLRDFHKWMVAVKKDTLWHDSIDKKHLSFIKLFSLFRFFLIIFIIFAQQFVLAILYVPAEETPCPYEFFQNGTESFLNFDAIYNVFWGIILSFLVGWMMVEHITVTWPHFVLPLFLYTFSEKYKFTRWFGRLLPKYERTYSSVNMFGLKTVYLALSIIPAASVFFCYGYYYCYFLFLIIIDNDYLHRALRSVTKNWKMLFNVSLFMLIVIYCYAVIAFITLKNEIDGEDNDKYCQSLALCYITMLRFGLIEHFLELPIDGELDVKLSFYILWRSFFDISFFVIVTIIGLNIVFGIILDTFSELRDERFAAEQDLRTTCFICNLPSYKFDRLSSYGFQKHVKEDHNIWAYIYYSIYLDQIDVTNHNAIEKYVYEKIKAGSTDYMPFQKALVLQEHHEAEKELKEDLEQLEQTVNERFNEIKSTLEVILREKK